MLDDHHALWAPDIIKESNGIACGDMLSLNAYRDNGKLYFNYRGNACSVVARRFCPCLAPDICQKLLTYFAA